jgi:hypothetical protein
MRRNISFFGLLGSPRRKPTVRPGGGYLHIIQYTEHKVRTESRIPAVSHRGIAVTFRGSCFHRVRLLPPGEALMRKGFFVYVGSDITRSCRIRSVNDGEERNSSLPIRHNQSDAKKANNPSDQKPASMRAKGFVHSIEHGGRFKATRSCIIYSPL